MAAPPEVSVAAVASLLSQLEGSRLKASLHGNILSRLTDFLAGKQLCPVQFVVNMVDSCMITSPAFSFSVWSAN